MQQESTSNQKDQIIDFKPMEITIVVVGGGGNGGGACASKTIAINFVGVCIHHLYIVRSFVCLFSFNTWLRGVSIRRLGFTNY